MWTPEALKEHVSVGVDLICNPQNVPSSADPEDGITSLVEEALNGRKARSKIDCWKTLWRHLFPDDCAIPESGMATAENTLFLCRHAFEVSGC
jgi:hypothetical protein